jgi:hypothetical protein
MPRRADHDGSVYFDQGRDKWVAAISLPNGKRIVRRLGTEHEARATLSDLRTRYIAGTLAAPTMTTLPDWYAHWRDAKTLRPSSLQVYSMSVARVVAQIGNARLDRLTTPFIQAAFDDSRCRGHGEQESATGSPLSGGLPEGRRSCEADRYVPARGCPEAFAPAEAEDVLEPGGSAAVPGLRPSGPSALGSPVHRPCDLRSKAC